MTKFTDVAVYFRINIKIVHAAGGIVTKVYLMIKLLLLNGFKFSFKNAQYFNVAQSAYLYHFWICINTAVT